MALYRILYWKDLPSQVKAWDAVETASVPLPAAFQEAIDRQAMRDRATSTTAYLDGWRWGEPLERVGTPGAVARAVAAELVVQGPAGG